MKTVTIMRDRPAEGTVSGLLDMVGSELRFYQEIAPHVGVKVPACVRAESTDAGTLLVLEDVSDRPAGAEPTVVAATLADLHRRWEHTALDRWPWLRPPGAAADAIGAAYDRLWPSLDARDDLTPRVRRLAAQLVGRIPHAERTEAGDSPLTLVNGNVTTTTIRTGEGEGEVIFIEWLDVRATSGAAELLWFLVSSVATATWGETLDAYGPPVQPSITSAAPAVAGQAFFVLRGLEEGSAAALGWIERLDALIGTVPLLASGA